jgi:16S rRNA (cytosine1402-N4)-methyltransferase
MTTFAHDTVMLREVIEALAPRAGGRYADATLGGGGHTEAILERSAPDGVVIGIDRDPDALEASRARLARFGDRAVFLHGSFGDLAPLLHSIGTTTIDGLVADLGVSSPQLDRPERGFSFRGDGPLDMRMDPTQGETARDLVARLSDREIATILRDYGEERKANAIARSIRRAVDADEFETTDDLRRTIYRVLGPKRGPRDPATRTFQALRIAVNEEVQQLETLVETIPDVLADDGVAAVISFHSLEDRIVKHAFRGDDRLVPLTKRPVIPADDEQEANPRARSAKLRAARRVPREEVVS